MKRIDSFGNNPAGFWFGGDSIAGTPATLISADWMNVLQETIVQAITDSGVSLNAAAWTTGQARLQLRDAVRRLAAGGASFRIGSDTGGSAWLNNLNSLGVLDGCSSTSNRKLQVGADGTVGVTTYAYSSSSPASLLRVHDSAGTSTDSVVRVSSFNITCLRLGRDNTGEVAGFWANEATTPVKVGSITITGSATTYNTTSDARLKNIAGEVDGAVVLEKTKPYYFTFKDDAESVEGEPPVYAGFIAQEWEGLAEGVVQTRDDGTKEMDYSKTTPFLYAVIRHQEERIKRLESFMAPFLTGELNSIPPRGVVISHKDQA